MNGMQIKVIEIIYRYELSGLNRSVIIYADDHHQAMDPTLYKSIIKLINCCGCLLDSSGGYVSNIHYTRQSAFVIHMHDFVIIIKLIAH